MSALTEAQKSAIVAIAGDDPGKRLKAYAALLPTWSKKPDAETDVKKPVVKVADTAAPRQAPTPAGQTHEENSRQTYERLAAENPFIAARYASRNFSAYEKK
jgi:hypothetical protein